MKYFLSVYYAKFLNNFLVSIPGVEIIPLPIDGEEPPVHSAGLQVIVKRELNACLCNVLSAMGEDQGLLIPDDAVGWSITITDSVVKCIEISPLSYNIAVFFSRSDFVTVGAHELQEGEEFLGIIRSELSEGITLKRMATDSATINSAYFGGYDVLASAADQASAIVKLGLPFVALTILDLSKFSNVDAFNWPGRYWVLVMREPT